MKKLIKDADDIGREPSDAELHLLEKEADDDAAVQPVASSTVDLAHIGLDQIAYIRRAVIDEQQVWTIHSAMGHPLGAARTFEQAWGAIMQNDLQPMYVN